MEIHWNCSQVLEAINAGLEPQYKSEVVSVSSTGGYLNFIILFLLRMDTAYGLRGSLVVGVILKVYLSYISLMLNHVL